MSIKSRRTLTVPGQYKPFVHLFGAGEDEEQED